MGTSVVRAVWPCAGPSARGNWLVRHGTQPRRHKARRQPADLLTRDHTRRAHGQRGAACALGMGASQPLRACRKRTINDGDREVIVQFLETGSHNVSVKTWPFA